LLIFGISHYSLAEYENAEKYFQQALEASLNVEDWENTDVIYVLLGNASGQRKDYIKARTHYTDAIKQNPKNSRAYIGLGSTFYMPALGNLSHNGYDDVDLSLLEQAIQSYKDALSPGMQQPPLAHVSTKASFALGQAYLLKTIVELNINKLVPDINYFDDPISFFEAVIQNCEEERCEKGTDFRLQSLTANSYANLGLIYYYIRDYKQAAPMYEKAIELLPPFMDRQHKSKTHYESKLREIYEQLQKSETG
jgi:tetratricopeptide (TPR) repeat protein